MDTITCPKCGTINSSVAMNCKQCRINLKFALQNPAELEDLPPLLVEDKQEKPQTAQSGLALSAISGWVAGLLAVGIFTFLVNIRHPTSTMTPAMSLMAVCFLLSPVIFCMTPILLIAGALGGLIARNIVFMLCRGIPPKRALIAALIVGGALAGLPVPWLVYRLMSPGLW